MQTKAAAMQTQAMQSEWKMGRREWDACRVDVKTLTTRHFVRAGGRYFRPTGQEAFPPSRRRLQAIQP
eukprot:2074467-Prymnesium_polylepis.1